MPPKEHRRLAGGANHRSAMTEKTISPSRGGGIRDNVHQIPRHCGAIIHILLTKRARAMVLCLLLDVMTNRFTLRSAHGKRTITFLPRETAQTHLIMHPAGRNGLYLSKHIS